MVGGVLGLLDGLSAWAYPEARAMMTAIVIGSTVKGIVTGVLAALVASRVHSIPVGVALGVVFGGVLSTLAAQGQADHYWAIVLPGMLVGAITGFVTQRRPRDSTLPASRQNTSVLPLLVVAMFCGPAAAGAQETGASPLSPLDFLVGRWEGTSEGQPGSGTVQRQYARVLGSRFLQVRNVSTYPPQAKNPKGEKHEDIGFFGFDQTRKRLVFRQFHSEGFVNEYVADSQQDANVLVFVTEAIENIPPGWRARETYTLIRPDEMEERFELAEPDKEYELYSRTLLRRIGPVLH